MPELLQKVHGNDSERQRRKLVPVKNLQYAIINQHGIPPSKDHVAAYHVAVKELSRKFGELVDGTYEFYLMSQGNYYNVEIGMAGVDTSSSLADLERTVNTIIDVMQNNSHKSFDVPVEGRRYVEEKTAGEIVKRILKNNGSLDYFDRMKFGFVERN